MINSLQIDRHFRASSIGLLALMSRQFYLGYLHNSNDATNNWLRLAHGASYALLPLLFVI